MTETAVATTKKNVKDLLSGAEFKKQLSNALPAHITPDRFCRLALTIYNKTPKLQQCTQESLFSCLLDLSQMGLEPDGRRAHLIPYGDKCTLIIDYKGLAELTYRSGLVSFIHADKVCENDKFVFDRGQILKHEIDYSKPRGNVYAYYALCRFKDSSEKAEVMSNDEVESIRKRSKAGTSGPWVTDKDEMGKKTVFRRLAKWLPMSSEFKDALEKDFDAIDVDSVVLSETKEQPPKPLFSKPQPTEKPIDEEHERLVNEAMIARSDNLKLFNQKAKALGLQDKLIPGMTNEELENLLKSINAETQNSEELL